nr:EIF2a-like PKR inhibitor [Wadden Sea poxvirus]
MNYSLEFCYEFPNIGDILQGVVVEIDNLLYVIIDKYKINALIVNYCNINIDKLNNVKNKLLNKKITVKVIRINRANGSVDVTHIL